MPTFLQWFNVDWRWRELNAAEQQVVRGAEALLQADPAGATLDWLAEVLGRVTERLPGRTVVAAAEDEMEVGWLIEAAQGATDQREPQGDDLVEFERLRDTASRELFPESLRAEDFLAAGVEKVARTLFFPKSVLTDIRKQAVRIDRSLSWMVQGAWAGAREAITALADPQALRAAVQDRLGTRRDQDTYAQTVFLGIEMIAQLDVLARRLDCSQSQLMILAWLMTKDAIAAQPSSGEA